MKFYRDEQLSESTLDINFPYAYLNRIDSKISGKGYSRELLNYIISECKKHGIISITTYIESQRPGPEGPGLLRSKVGQDHALIHVHLGVGKTPKTR